MHQWNLSHILSTQQDHLLGCLIAPAVRALIPTLMRPQSDGRGSSAHPRDLPGMEEVTRRVLALLMPHGGFPDPGLVVRGFNVGLLAVTHL